MTSLAGQGARTPTRVDGYAPIEEYAVIGNKRTAALVALDGSIDWLPVPTLAGPTAFAALLDPTAGSFALAPVAPFTARRRYLDGTNVLETTFETAEGTVRVTDAMSRPLARGLLWNQIVRKIDGLAGTVPMRWSIAPRFDYGATPVEPERRAGVPVFFHGPDVLAVEAFDAGEPRLGPHEVAGELTVRDGDSAVLALSAFHAEPLTFSTRDHLLDRLDGTINRWQIWLRACEYDGPWAETVQRSALALDLLVDDETGAIAAAATMGLPEQIGGSRNYDYRYAWLRDCNLTLEAMLRLGFRDQVHTSLGWMIATSRRTHPRLRPMYRLDGSVRLPDEPLPLAGYRGSQPVLLGNGAQEQLQLGNYGDMLDMAFHFAESRASLPPQAAVQLAEATDFLCKIWRLDDSGIWELGDLKPYTQGKLASWLALDRAIALAESGELPDRNLLTWKRERESARQFITGRCWSPEQRAYARAADGDELDAAVLLAARGPFFDAEPDRMNSTIDAVRRELGAGGPLLYRYTGMQEQEGAFLACSFWAAEALARAGRLDEAGEMMDELVGLANDVGLYSEEMDPSSHAFLGNVPQALTHLALVNAAFVIADRQR